MSVLNTGSVFRISVACLFFVAPAIGAQAIKVSEGSVEVPTYEFSARETQPPLFANSTARGQYPFATYTRPFKSNVPKPRAYRAIFLENEYVKLTYLPEFGGRFFALYDKIRGREVFYRNDVIKPAGYNTKDSFPLFGIELTGPWDTHALALGGEPFWSNKVVRHEDGSVSLVLGSIDPMYHMKVDLSATLYPGVAAMRMSVFCYNQRDGRMPQMFWISGALKATEKTRFIYPMTRTIGHTTSEIADWPVYNGLDYSWDQNNKHMLGVFGIDTYDNFQGAYKYDQDYGVFRYADRRVVQGMKMWTFGYSESGTNLERAYTDHAGPYIEVQSGRYVWDGHYEWVGPHKVEDWSEWWVPVSGIGGLTTITRDLALNLEVEPDAAGKNSTVKIGISTVRALPGSKLVVKAQTGEILSTAVDFAPEKPFRKTISGIQAGKDGLTKLTVLVTDAAGREIMNYQRPDENPGRKEYTPFTKGLEKPQKSPEQMSIEELVLAAEFKLKELNSAAANDLLTKALERDPGFSRAHLLLGIHHFIAGRYQPAITHLEKAIERDPYTDEAYYYLAMSQFAVGDTKKAERNLYFIWPLSGYFGEREYHLGRLAFLHKDLGQAAGHLERAIVANGYDLGSRHLLALTLREQGKKDEALKQLAEVEKIDPTDRPALAERFFLTGDAAARTELERMMGGQSQEVIDVSNFYRQAERWKEAAAILRLVEKDNKDVWGTTPEFYYTLAYCMDRAGDGAQAAEYRKKARSAAGNVDRFPDRQESEAPLAAAIQADPKDAVARFNLACWLYYHERQAEAIKQWEAAVEIDPANFSARRALGLAYGEQGYPVEKAAAELEKAVDLRPAHLATLNDLSTMYARAGRFDEQLVALKKALTRSPNDDSVAQGLLGAYLVKGQYADADKLVNTHRFAPQHRTYGLRDKYRFMRYGEGAAAFNKGGYEDALRLWESALKPPVSLGVDNFANDMTPRVNYYMGRALEALGRKAEAQQAYEKAIFGADHLQTGDKDAWGGENFHMVLALARLGRAQQAVELSKRFEDFAQSQMESKYEFRRAEARYTLGLIRKRAGRNDEARKLMETAVQILPDYLAPRYELRGDGLNTF